MFEFIFVKITKHEERELFAHKIVTKFSFKTLLRYKAVFFRFAFLFKDIFNFLWQILPRYVLIELIPISLLPKSRLSQLYTLFSTLSEAETHSQSSTAVSFQFFIFKQMGRWNLLKIVLSMDLALKLGKGQYRRDVAVKNNKLLEAILQS